MTIKEFTDKADGIINDFIGGATDDKEFRDEILDLLIETTKKVFDAELDNQIKIQNTEDKWMVEHNNLGTILVLPIDDIDEHDEYSKVCKCEPKVIYGNGKIIIVHNAFDGRQYDEQIKEILKKD
jgi:hypothetical protein